MTDKPSFYITTAINYTNGPPHIGHAYEAVAADSLARYHRMMGEDVFFLTGTDEHGQKVSQAADAKGISPIEVCDHYVSLFQALNKRFEISNDFYIRTTLQKHIDLSQWCWKRAVENGDIYLGVYEGWYNIREEKFVTESEALKNDYKDPGSGNPLTKTTEDSYFFKMGKYQDQLIKHIKENPGFIFPEERRSDILARLEEPLHDLSVSRTTFDWGIPIPEMENFDEKGKKHVMYVWFDALTNYLSGIDYPDGENSRYWSANVHLIGKDISWFHCVIWPCMLMSIGVPLPKAVVTHGFISGPDGRKMSKSYGNVIEPNEMLDKYTSDTLRYFLLAEAGSFGVDFSFSESSLLNRHDSELQGALGNLAKRSFTLCQKYCGGIIPDVQATRIFDAKELIDTCINELETYQLQKILFLTFEELRRTNKYLSDLAPWHMKDEDAKARQTVIVRTLLESMYILTHLFQPVLPNTAEKIFQYIGTPPITYPKLLKSPWSCLTPGTKVVVGEMLFPRIAETRFQKKKGKDQGKDAAAAAKGKGKKKLKVLPVDISRISLKVGRISKVSKHPAAERLYVEEIDVGEEQPRQIVSGLVDFIPIEEMQDRLVVVVCNLKARPFKGVESQGMVIAGNNEDGSVVELLDPPADSVVGERITFEGYEDNADDVLNPRKRIFEKIKFDLSTDENRVAVYKGIPFTTSAGVCCTKTLTSAKLG